MNILLISLQKDPNVIGLKYLHYYLLAHNYHSTMLFLPKFIKRDKNIISIKKFIKKLNPKFIGFSLMSEEYLQARDLTRSLKQEFESIPIIWGGIHPTISPEACLNYADYVCIGEGEQTILDIANAINKQETLENINNICYLKDNKLIKNQLYPLITDLDAIPIFEHIPANSFIQEKNGSIIKLTKKVFNRYDRFRGLSYDVMTSRGCTFSCTYCCNNFISQLYNTRKVRRRSLDNTIVELRKAITDNPEIGLINFTDDCFLSCSDEAIKAFCKVFKKEIARSFFIKSMPIYINETKIKHLKNAGLAWIEVGLQSGSDQTCKNIFHRKSFQSDFLHAAKILHKYKIAPYYDVILDNPFESDNDRIETIKAITKIKKPFYLVCFSLTFFIGTELQKMAEKECPDKIENTFKKDYLKYHKTTINSITKLSAFLGKKSIYNLIHNYQRNPNSDLLKYKLFAYKFISAFILEPINTLRLIKLTQYGSYIKTFRVIPYYFRVGFRRYIKQF
jgi:radical SAM superfamily enzyme YgiQ (UPF0313 family)